MERSQKGPDDALRNSVNQPRPLPGQPWAGRLFALAMVLMLLGALTAWSISCSEPAHDRKGLNRDHRDRKEAVEAVREAMAGCTAVFQKATAPGRTITPAEATVNYGLALENLRTVLESNRALLNQDFAGDAWRYYFVHRACLDMTVTSCGGYRDMMGDLDLQWQRLCNDWEHPDTARYALHHMNHLAPLTDLDRKKLGPDGTLRAQKAHWETKRKHGAVDGETPP